MAMFDNDLDPLGDGSLLNSWTFNTTLENVQGGNVFDGAAATFAAAKFDKGLLSNVDRYSTASGGLDGDQDATIIHWITYLKIDSGDDIYYGTIKYGEGSQRYNVELYHKSYMTDTYNYCYIDLHKGAVRLRYDWPRYANGTKVMMVYTYNAATQENQLIVDGVLRDSVTQQMKFQSSKVINLYQYGSNRTSYLDQLMVFGKTLSIAEIVDIRDNMQTYIPPPEYLGEASLLGSSNLSGEGFASSVFGNALLTSNSLVFGTGKVDYLLQLGKALLIGESNLSSQSILINFGKASITGISFTNGTPTVGKELRGSVNLVSTSEFFFYTTTLYRRYPLYKAAAVLNSTSLIDTTIPKIASILSHSNLQARAGENSEGRALLIGTSNIAVFNETSGSATLVSTSNIIINTSIETLGNSLISSGSNLTAEGTNDNFTNGERLTFLEAQLDQLEASTPSSTEFIKVEDIKVFFERIRYV